MNEQWDYVDTEGRNWALELTRVGLSTTPSHARHESLEYETVTMPGGCRIDRLAMTRQKRAARARKEPAYV